MSALDWGLTRLLFDNESLAGGLVSLKECRGITRDGMAFDIPGTDPVPPAREIAEHFPPSRQSVSVHLAVPVEKSAGGNCLLDDSSQGRQVRFVAVNVTLPDDNTGFNEREVTVCRLNFSIMFGDEPLNEFSSIPIADVVRASDGTFALNARFVPPSLSIAASDTLMGIARRVMEMLVAKGKTLSERRRQQPSGQIEFTTSDVTLLGLLQTINAVLPALYHQYSVLRCHPATLYQVLASLVGQLTTFSPEMEVRLNEWPAYDHAAPAAGFLFLEGKIMQLLEAVVSTNCTPIRLEKKSESRFIGRFADEALLRTAQFYLTTSGDFPERKVVDELPLKIKVGSPDDIDTLVGAALQGLALIHTPRAPAGLPTRPNLIYFRLDKTGKFWDSIRKNSAVGIFLPGEFRGLSLELIAVNEN
jgi:type VI secretion system protein ImpJ